MLISLPYFQLNLFTAMSFNSFNFGMAMKNGFHKGNTVIGENWWNFLSWKICSKRIALWCFGGCSLQEFWPGVVTWRCFYISCKVPGTPRKSDRAERYRCLTRISNEGGSDEEWRTFLGLFMMSQNFSSEFGKYTKYPQVPLPVYYYNQFQRKKWFVTEYKFRTMTPPN